MGLFDKKYCDICGEKIGLLGNRKLEDGNLCKDCAKKLSPWFSERRNSTVQEIKAQLDWREKNRERTARFCTTRAFGERTRLLLDETHRWFTVTRAKNPADDNSDVLDFSAITGCRTDIDESRTELKLETRDSDGKIVRRSYNPPRYEYDYDFYIIVSVNVPYFSEMKFKLNDDTVHIPFQPRWAGGGFMQDRRDEPLYDPCYRGFKESCDEICALMERLRSGAVNPTAAAPAAAGIDPELAEVMKNISWRCAECRTSNSGTMTCRHCGAPLNDAEAIALARKLVAVQSEAATVERAAVAQSWSCPYCGATNQGKFCEHCGAKKP